MTKPRQRYGRITFGSSGSKQEHSSRGVLGLSGGVDGFVDAGEMEMGVGANSKGGAAEKKRP